jgi:hypothetical protein
MNAYVAKSAAIAKVHIVATVPTGKAFSDLLIAFTETSLRLMLARAPLSGKKGFADALQSHIDWWEKEAARWVEETKQFNVAGLTDERRWAVLKSNLDVAQGAAKDLREKQQTARLEVLQGSMALLKLSLSELANVQMLVRPLVQAVRQELDTAGDEAAYGQLLEAMMSKSVSSTQSFIAGIQKLADEESAPAA